MSLLRAAEGRDGLVRNRSSSPSATRREDGADEEADDGVADKREYFHGVNEDKNRGKAGRYRSTIYYYLMMLHAILCRRLFFGWKGGKGGSLRSQLSRKFEGARKWAIFAFVSERD